LGAVEVAKGNAGGVCARDEVVVHEEADGFIVFGGVRLAGTVARHVGGELVAVLVLMRQLCRAPARGAERLVFLVACGGLLLVGLWLCVCVWGGGMGGSAADLGVAPGLLVFSGGGL
jgi:hypothetical protein